MADRNDYREHRSFRDEGRYGSARGDDAWRRDRYGARYDQDRAYAGRDREDYRETWHAAGGAPYGDLEPSQRGPDYEAFGAPHDYAYHPHDDLHPDYLNWREEQLRMHDRDYQEWRSDRQRRYDDDYRRQRTTEGGQQFGRAYGRGQHNMARGMRQQDAGGDIGDYHRRMAEGFGRGSDEPSGMLEPPGAVTRRPQPMARGPDGGDYGGAAGEYFDETSSQVRAAADGWDTRRSAEAFEERRWRDRDRDRS